MSSRIAARAAAVRENRNQSAARREAMRSLRDLLVELAGLDGWLRTANSVKGLPKAWCDWASGCLEFARAWFCTLSYAYSAPEQHNFTAALEVVAAELRNRGAGPDAFVATAHTLLVWVAAMAAPASTAAAAARDWYDGGDAEFGAVFGFVHAGVELGRPMLDALIARGRGGSGDDCAAATAVHTHALCVVGGIRDPVCAALDDGYDDVDDDDAGRVHRRPPSPRPLFVAPPPPPRNEREPSPVELSE
jgi:hypothetical protein